MKTHTLCFACISWLTTDIVLELQQTSEWSQSKNQQCTKRLRGTYFTSLVWSRVKHLVTSQSVRVSISCLAFVVMFFKYHWYDSFYKSTELEVTSGIFNATTLHWPAASSPQIRHLLHWAPSFVAPFPVHNLPPTLFVEILQHNASRNAFNW